MNQLLCPEWVSDTAALSAQYVNENHVLSDCSLCALGLQIMNESQRKRESCPHSTWTRITHSWFASLRTWFLQTWFTSLAGRSMNELSDANHVCEHEWLLLCSKSTWQAHDATRMLATQLILILFSNKFKFLISNFSSTDTEGPSTRAKTIFFFSVFLVNVLRIFASIRIHWKRPKTL